MKRVHFDKLVKIRTMYVYAFAMQKARRGDWETFARDNERFKFRIVRTTEPLNKILESGHRSKIYRERFEIF